MAGRSENIAGAVSNRTLVDPVTGYRTTGGLDLYGRVPFFGLPYNFDATLTGLYGVDLAHGSNYSIIPDETFVNVGRDFIKWRVSARAGLFRPAAWEPLRVAGVRLRVDLPYANFLLYGGRAVFGIWDDNLQHLDLGGGIVGVEAGADYKRISGRIDVRYKGDDSRGQETRVSGQVAARLGGRLTASARGDLRRDGEGNMAFNARTGMHIDAGRTAIDASYVHSALPPFLRVRSDISPPSDDRGEAIVRVDVRNGPSIQVRGEAGGRSVGGGVGVDTPFLGGVVLYRRLRDMDVNSVSATASGGIRLPHGVRLLPYADFSYQDGHVLSANDEGVRLAGGANVVWSSGNRCVDIMGGVGYAVGSFANSPFGGITLNWCLGGVSQETRAPSSSRSWMLPRISVRGLVRRFGELMVRAAGKFSHWLHMMDAKDNGNAGGIKSVNNDKMFSCPDCHGGKQQVIGVDQTKLKSVCSNCHDMGEFAKRFQALAMVRHPGPIPSGMGCLECHVDMSTTKAPTEGKGAIIIYPHQGQTVLPDRNIWNHKDQVASYCDKTCHDRYVQYQGHAVPTCDSCHSNRSPHKANYAKLAHKQDAMADVAGCTSCHDDLSSCRSCHTTEGVLPRNVHNGIGFMRIEDGDMRHGRSAELCVSCHEPAAPVCKRCH